MPFPRFTKVIINHFLKQHDSLSNLKYQHYHTIKDDGIVCRLKFVRIGEDYQEYGLFIPETMLTEAIKQSESYQIFIKYSNGQIRLKKSRSKESEPEPESVKRKTSSKRRVKNKVTLSGDENIISDGPDTALELGKSISQIKVEEEEAARQVHATHARIVTKSVPELTRRRKSGKVTYDPPKKLKGVPSLTPEEQEAVDIMQALKESKKTSKTKSEYSEEDKLDDEEKDDKEGDAYDEDDKTESDKYDINKYKICVRKDEDEEMINAKVDDSNKGDEEITDAAKADAEKTSEVKDDPKKTKLPPTSSSLSVSSEVKIQSEVLHTQSPSVLSVPVCVISEPIVLTPVQESPSIASATTLPPLFVYTTPYVPQQTTTPIPTPTITTDDPIITTAISEFDALFVVQLRVSKLEKDVFDIKKLNLSVEVLAALKIQVPSVVDNYLGSKVGDVFQKELKKHTADLIQKYYLQQIPELPKKQTPTVDLEQESKKTPSEILKIKREQAEKQKMPKFTIKSTDKAALQEYDQKSTLYQIMHANKSFNKKHANHRLYHDLMEALMADENAIDKGVADTVQAHKRKHDDDEDADEDPPAGPNQGKQTKRRRTKDLESSKKPSTTKETPKGNAPSKGSKTGKSAPAKEPVEEPIAEVVMDDASDDVVHDENQPQDASKPTTPKTPNPYWFKQPPRPPTPDPEWNKRQVVLDQPEQPWFNQMVSAIMDPLTFDDLMATLIYFSKLDWNNLEGDRYPFDLSKPLPLQGHRGHLTVAADYFFNNHLEYLKSSYLKRTYTMSITKTKEARSQLNKFSKHNVYSTKKILGLKSVSVKKLHRYSHLEEIVVKRADRKFYKFKEGDFVDLHMNDIEDMLLLAIQHKLFHLTNNHIKKINITPPQQTVPGIEFKELYTPSHKPPGVIYEDLTKQKRVMRADELYKFSGGTLKKVWDELH
ncbi:hypothetical protein Tco_1439025 [Tanacetum coccineum]